MTEPVLLTAVRTPHEGEPELEPVTIVRDGDAIVLTLDDGEQLELDRRKLGVAVNLRARRRGVCSRCGTTDEGKTYEWANLTGRYDDVTDYERMCRSCHRRYDNARRRGGDA